LDSTCTCPCSRPCTASCCWSPVGTTKRPAVLAHFDVDCCGDASAPAPSPDAWGRAAALGPPRAAAEDKGERSCLRSATASAPASVTASGMAAASASGVAVLRTPRLRPGGLLLPACCRC
jgi:hypothetical protein